MDKKKILADLYKRGKVTYQGLEKAVKDGVITHNDLLEIVGVESGT